MTIVPTRTASTVCVLAVCALVLSLQVPSPFLWQLLNTFPILIWRNIDLVPLRNKLQCYQNWQGKHICLVNLSQFVLYLKLSQFQWNINWQREWEMLESIFTLSLCCYRLHLQGELRWMFSWVTWNDVCIIFKRFHISKSKICTPRF